MIEGDEDEVDEGMTDEVDVRVVIETLRALLLEALVDRTEVVDLAEMVEMTEEVDRAAVVVITEPVMPKSQSHAQYEHCRHAKLSCTSPRLTGTPHSRRLNRPDSASPQSSTRTNSWQTRHRGNRRPTTDASQGRRGRPRQGGGGGRRVPVRAETCEGEE